jgi:hypothetical protein
MQGTDHSLALQLPELDSVSGSQPVVCAHGQQSWLPDQRLEVDAGGENRSPNHGDIDQVRSTPASGSVT